MILLVAALGTASATGPRSTQVAEDPVAYALREQLASSPEDYATAVALARRAVLLGDHETALFAWTSAEQISGPNLEILLGQSTSLIHLGRAEEALAVAEAATVLSPDYAPAWSVWAWARSRHRSVFGLSERRAAAGYRRALALDDTQGIAWCSLTWLQAGRADRFAARRSAGRASSLGQRACAESALATHGGRPWEVWGGLHLTGTFLQDAAYLRAGALGVAHVGTRLADLVHIEAYGRALSLGTREPNQPVQQQAVWARAGVSHGGHGGEILAGHLHTGGGPNAPVTGLAARAWTTWWATVTGGISWVDLGDNAVLRGSVDLSLPLTAQWTIALGGELGTYSQPDVRRDELTGSGHLSVAWTGERASLRLGGRGGRERSPLRLDIPTLWNFDSPMIASGSIVGSYAVTPAVSLQAGYEVIRLQPSTDLEAVSHNHQLSVGLTFSAGSTRRR